MQSVKLLATEPRDRGRAVLDQWSPAVIGAGALTALFGLTSEVVFIGVLGFEIGQAIPDGRRWLGTNRETLANKTADVVLFMLGNWIGKKLKEELK